MKWPKTPQIREWSGDLSKAFDCVDRQALLRKLEWYGVSPHWFTDYFSGRMQCVRGSSMEHVDYGVIQGSILGPIMFNVLTNDLYAHLSDQCKAVSYADDTVILHSAPPSDEGLTALKASVEGDLASLATWFKNNGLKVNPSKTEMSLLGTLPVTKKPQISVWTSVTSLWHQQDRFDFWESCLIKTWPWRSMQLRSCGAASAYWSPWKSWVKLCQKQPSKHSYRRSSSLIWCIAYRPGLPHGSDAPTNRQGHKLRRSGCVGKT